MGVGGGGERETMYLSLHCHHQNDFCIKMGSDESHFDVSVGSDGQNHKTVSTNHNLFEEKGEPKRYRTEVLSLGDCINCETCYFCLIRLLCGRVLGAQTFTLLSL